MLLLLLACGYSSYYPDPGTVDLFVDTGVAADVPCGHPDPSAPTVYVRFTNQGLDDLLVWEVASDCRQDFDLYLYGGSEGAVVHPPGAVLAVRTLQGELVTAVTVPGGTERLDVVVP